MNVIGCSIERHPLPERIGSQGTDSLSVQGGVHRAGNPQAVIRLYEHRIRDVRGAGTTLEIQFRGGETYRYLNVPPSIYEGLIDAASKGQFFHRSIRGRYAYQRVPSG